VTLEQIGSRRWQQTLAELIEAARGDDPLPSLIATIEQVVPIDNTVAYVFRRSGRPIVLYDDWDDPAHEAHRQAMVLYFGSAYLLDPFYRAFLSDVPAGLHTLRELAPDRFRQTDYYEKFYKGVTTRDEASYLVPAADGSMLEISLNRVRPFGVRELQRLRDIEPIVLSVASEFVNRADVGESLSRRHVPATHDRLESAVEAFGARLLTPREREIVRLLLRGHSVKSTAERLELSPGTVKIHRRNIYAKLGISSQSQLFSLFFDFLSPDR